MYYLYYNNPEKQVEITSETRNGRGLEMLETNASLESLVAHFAGPPTLPPLAFELEVAVL